MNEYLFISTSELSFCINSIDQNFPVFYQQNSVRDLLNVDIQKGKKEKAIAIHLVVKNCARFFTIFSMTQTFVDLLFHGCSHTI